MKKGDKLYRAYGYNDIVEVTVTRAGRKTFEVNSGSTNSTHDLNTVGSTFFTTREAAERDQDHSNAAETFLEEIQSFQKICILDLMQHLSLEEINLRRSQNQEFFAKAVKVGAVPGSTVKVLWSTVVRRNDRLRPQESQRSRNSLKVGTLLTVLAVGPFRNGAVGLRVELNSDPKEVFYVRAEDVGLVK
jgi:hypothetical protein